MEIATAKDFYLYRYNLYGKNIVYHSKDLKALLELNNNSFTGIFAVLDTEKGETLFEIDWSYSNEPLIMNKHMHKDSWLKFHNNCDFKEI